MNIDWAGAGVLVFGILLGVAALPWQRKLGSEGGLIFVAAIACFWPVLLPFAVLHALRAYRDKWREYLAYTSHVKAPDSKPFPDFPARETVRHTYFKSKDDV